MRTPNETSLGLGAVPTLSYLSALAVALSGAGGLWLPETYARETPSWAAQGQGQDMVDLFFVAPLLALSAFLAQRGRKVFLFVLAGTLLYGAYSFVLYGFCVHFNRLFLLYCAALGLPVYALALLALKLQPMRVATWFDPQKPVVLPAFYLLFLALAFYPLWLSEDLPAVLHGTPPKTLVEAGLFTNPVHVLDLSLVLPAMLAASVGLLRKQAFGYPAFPILAVFSILMAVAIGGMSAVLVVRGMGGGMAPVYVFGVAALCGTAVLFRFLGSLRR